MILAALIIYQRSVAVAFVDGSGFYIFLPLLPVASELMGLTSIGVPSPALLPAVPKVSNFPGWPLRVDTFGPSYLWRSLGWQGGRSWALSRPQGVGHMYVHVRVHGHVYVYACVYVHVCMCISMCISMRLCMCMGVGMGLLGMYMCMQRHA